MIIVSDNNKTRKGKQRSKYTAYQGIIRNRIKEIIVQMGKTNQRIGKDLTFSGQTISAIRKGDIGISLDFIERFAHYYLNDDICYLYTGITNPIKYGFLNLNQDEYKNNVNKRVISILSSKAGVNINEPSKSTKCKIKNEQQKITLAIIDTLSSSLHLDFEYLCTGIQGIKQNTLLNAISAFDRNEQIMLLEFFDNVDPEKMNELVNHLKEIEESEKTKCLKDILAAIPNYNNSNEFSKEWLYADKNS